MYRDNINVMRRLFQGRQMACNCLVINQKGVMVEELQSESGGICVHYEELQSESGVICVHYEELQSENGVSCT